MSNKKGRVLSEEHKAKLSAGRAKRSNGTVIMLSKKSRIFSVDERNWAFQKSVKKEDGMMTWQSKFYGSSLSSLIKSISHRMLNSELKLGISTSDLKSLSDSIKEAEDNIIKRLDKIVQNS